MYLFFSKWIEVEVIIFKVATIVNVKINNYILIRFKNYIKKFIACDYHYDMQWNMQ